MVTLKRMVTVEFDVPDENNPHPLTEEHSELVGLIVSRSDRRTRTNLRLAR